MKQSDEHIKPLGLFDIARSSGRPLNETENEHLRRCEACQRILEVFARQFGKAWKPPQDKAGDAA
jgi:hypothetical protein